MLVHPYYDAVRRCCYGRGSHRYLEAVAASVRATLKTMTMTTRRRGIVPGRSRAGGRRRGWAWPVPVPVPAWGRSEGGRYELDEGGDGVEETCAHVGKKRIEWKERSREPGRRVWEGLTGAGGGEREGRTSEERGQRVVEKGRARYAAGECKWKRGQERTWETQRRSEGEAETRLDDARRQGDDTTTRDDTTARVVWDAGGSESLVWEGLVAGGGAGGERGCGACGRACLIDCGAVRACGRDWACTSTPARRHLWVHSAQSSQSMRPVQPVNPPVCPRSRSYHDLRTDGVTNQ